MTKGFTDGMRTSISDSWTTPRDFYERLNQEFNFALDAAALQSSTLCPGNWYGPDHPDELRRDALSRDWSTDSKGGAVWLNPPYGRAIKPFMAKAHSEIGGGITIVALVPARTDTNWWWDSCIMHEVRFIKGRLKFGGQKNSAPFPSAVVVMRKH
jgi:phage N-6-adenine-methyltransferase